jgi:hypothetical protein
VGTVRLFEHFQRPEVFSARRASQRPPQASNANRWAVGATNHYIQYVGGRYVSI